MGLPKRRIIEKQYNVNLTDYLYDLMKQFYPGGSGVFEEDPDVIHMAQGLTEWFAEKIHHILWPSQALDLHPV